MGRARFLIASLLAAAPALAQEAGRQTDRVAAPQEAPSRTWTLGEIEITTNPIYRPETAARNGLANLVNATHWTTNEAVVRREIWLDPGDPIDERFAEELERNLRATGLFAEVAAELRATDDPGVRDLVVVTRDRLSLSGGASASFVGDIASGGFSLSESNLFGTGDRLRFAFFENDMDEFRGSLGYRDRYFLGTWTTMDAEVGRTEEGDFAGLRFRRPFRYLEDDFAWDVGASTAATDRNYFSRNEIVAEVPFDDARFESSARWREGTPERFWSRGVALRLIDRQYGAARGPAGPAVRIPGDTTTLFVGGLLQATNISEFRKETSLDTLGFVEDLQLGTRGALELGATLRDEDGREEEVQPTAAVTADASLGLGPTRYLTAAIGGSARTYAGDAVGWDVAVDLRAFDLTLRPHTLAAAARYVEAEEDQDLPVQLALGEGNGLRGYPRREFTGERVLTLNFEDRYDLDARLGAFDFGAVAFFDMGWISDRGEGLGQPLRSAGFGLRIGSESLLGAGVLRVDLSFPLDEVDGESYDPLVSFSLGQAFEFR